MTANRTRVERRSGDVLSLKLSERATNFICTRCGLFVDRGEFRRREIVKVCRIPLEYKALFKMTQGKEAVVSNN